MFKFDAAIKQTTVQATLDGRPVFLHAGMNVAAALLGIGEIIFGISPSSRKPCSPRCLMGVCFECRMEIDGIQRQACMTEVREGMIINRYLDADKGEGP